MFLLCVTKQLTEWNDNNNNNNNHKASEFNSTRRRRPGENKKRKPRRKHVHILNNRNNTPSTMYVGTTNHRPRITIKFKTLVWAVDEKEDFIIFLEKMINQMINIFRLNFIITITHSDGLYLLVFIRHTWSTRFYVPPLSLILTFIWWLHSTTTKRYQFNSNSLLRQQSTTSNNEGEDH